MPLGPLVQREGGPAEAHRLFAMLLVASIAETLVFLGALGNAVRLAAGGRWWSGVAALVAASLAFGFFHLTYPAPWNTVGVCLGLSPVWALVSLVFLVSRSLVAAIILNNIMAVIGFVENTVELSGTATIGWLQAAAALGVFALVFSLSVRRTP